MSQPKGTPVLKGREDVSAAFKRLAQRAGLRLVRLQMDVRNQLHTLKYRYVLQMFKTKERREFLPGLKAEVSLAKRG